MTDEPARQVKVSDFCPHGGPNCERKCVDVSAEPTLDPGWKVIPDGDLAHWR